MEVYVVTDPERPVRLSGLTKWLTTGRSRWIARAGSEVVGERGPSTRVPRMLAEPTMDPTKNL